MLIFFSSVANIFPIFGLIFATMGLYCMVENEQVALVTTEDTKNYDRFILGIARLNHAFQQVKFWEFTQPCLYLARALPYISTGRTVEGYMVTQKNYRGNGINLSICLARRSFVTVSMRCTSSKRFDSSRHITGLAWGSMHLHHRIEWIGQTGLEKTLMGLGSHRWAILTLILPLFIRLEPQHRWISIEPYTITM